MVDALGSGHQILILRKGGVSEGRRGFQVEHAEFLLMPTLFHQQQELVVPSWRIRFEESQTVQEDPSQIRMNYCAHVISWRRLETLAAAERLRGQHIWRDQVISERFTGGEDSSIHALALRVFKLPETVSLPILPHYGGCKSWVELDEEIATDHAVPVLSKEVFNEKLSQFHAALDGNSAVLSSASGP